MARNWHCAALLAAACACANAKPIPAPATAPSASSSPSAASSSPGAGPSLGPSRAEPDFDLAIGEAIELEGAPLPGPSNPTSDAIDFRGLPKHKLVVVARAAGLATLHFTDPAGGSQSRSFRVTEVTCRKTPLHPAITLARNDHAIIETPDLAEVEVLLHKQPIVASASFDREGSRIRISARMEGHTTVLAVKRDHSILLYDVFVGDTCADRRYASVAPAIPPGSVGPKGDGTCQRVDGKKVTPAPCPELAKADKLSKEAFSSLACEWIDACGRRGEEGCCVDCTNDFAMKFDRQCALRALRQKNCADVLKIVDAKGCLR